MVSEASSERYGSYATCKECEDETRMCITNGENVGYLVECRKVSRSPGGDSMCNGLGYQIDATNKKFAPPSPCRICESVVHVLGCGH